jgi:SAM-dependent methyltransferase
MSMRRHAPATARNREPIAAVLAEALPAHGLVLEVASGSGEHAAFFAERFSDLTWQPSDPDDDSLASIADWCAGLANVLPPLALDAAEAAWPIGAADAILCVNMVHISPWEATLGLMAGAGRLLAAGAPLILYGPYRQRDVPTAESNEAFDVSLKSRNPAWGLRHVEDVSAAAAACGLLLERIVAMSANNLSLVFRRES